MSKNLKTRKYLNLLDVKHVSVFFLENKLKIYILLILNLIGLIFPLIPYINIILKINIIWPLIVAMSFYILHIEARIIVATVIFLFIMSPLLIIFRFDSSVELAGNMIFFLILVSWINIIKDFKKNK